MSKYKVGDKFVLEIANVEQMTSGTWYTTNAPIKIEDYFLNPLERLDSDYINENYGELQDEAYAKGLEDGRDETLKWIRHNEDDSYKKGFTDALNAIGTLIHAPSEAREHLMHILEELRIGGKVE